MENTKTQKFLEEYGNLVKKYDVDLATFPVFVPDGQGSFKITLQTIPIDLEEQKKAQIKKGFITGGK